MKFTFKNAAEIAAMTEDEAKTYHNDMIEYFKSLEVAQKEAIENKAGKEEITALKEELSTLRKAVKEQGLVIAKKEERKVLAGNLKDAIKAELINNTQLLKDLKARSTKESVSIVVKVDDLTFANSITGEIPQAQREAGVNRIARRQPFILSLVTSGTTSSNVVSWVEEVANVGGADYTLETAAKNKRSKTWKTNSESLKKITVLSKVSEEMLEDVDFMASEITNDLLRDLELKTDLEVLAGADGAALNGIITQSTAFAAGSFAGTIATPNVADVIAVAQDMIEVANYMPNVAVMHPTDLTILKLAKDTLGRKLYPELDVTTPTINGLPVVTNTGVSKGYVLVMDSTKSKVWFKNQIRIESDRDGEDFSHNMMTFLAEVRLLHVIKGNDKTAFVYAEIAQAIEDIATPAL